MYLIGRKGVWTNRKEIEQNFEHRQESVFSLTVV